MNYENFSSHLQGVFVNLSSLVGNRLLELRKARGMSQSVAATTAGVSREMWGRYEKGALPGTEVLIALASSGFDVNYILTGRHDASTRTQDASEDVLLNTYRRCPPQGRAHLIQTAALLSAGLSTNESPAPQKVKQTVRGQSTAVQVAGSVHGDIGMPKRRGK